MSESKINIPNFSYPFKQVNKEEEYYKLFAKIDNGNYLFSKDGFWHGGIHFSDTVLTDVKATQGIRAIADGELVAYRINDKYLQNDDEEKEDEGLYSNGFFLLKHYFEYPKRNKLTFFSLYMHTASKNKYDFSTHKVIGTNRFLRKSTSYKEEDKLEELAENTKITLAEEVGNNRYKVLYVDKTERTDNATIHKSNIKAIEDALSLKTININTPTNTIKTLTTPIKIKAGEVIGLVGEYNRSKQINRELLHLEVFTKDDVKSFSDTAKEKYKKDTSEDKPKPIKVIIEDKKNLYEKICECKLDKNSNIREGFSNNSLKYNNETTAKDTRLEIDFTTQQKVGKYIRVKVLKIDTADVSSDNYTVITNVLTDKKDVFKVISEKSTKKEIILKDIKIEKNSANEKYLLYINDSNKYVKYSDCKEIHPITFDWATIIDESSNDDISIFTNLHKYLLPEVEEYKEEVLKVSSMYEKLFKEIDTNSNGQIEAQELEDATKKEGIKKITSKFIVKHSSEWDKTVNVPNNVKQIIEEHKDNIKNYDKIKQHLENEEKRVDKLAFFEECKGTSDFPTSDKVFHINPIGLVGVFKQTKRCYCYEQGLISNPCQGEGISILNEHYEKLAQELGVEKEVLQTVAKVESGYRGSFQRQYSKHATILYEYNHMRKYLIEKGYSNVQIQEYIRTVPHLVNTYRAVPFGTNNEQLTKLEESKKIDFDSAIKSCSWGKFQVLGKTYNWLYKTPKELEEAMNMCEIQQMAYFKEYLKNVNGMISAMKNKDWEKIAELYNGKNYKDWGYDTKMKDTYKSIKGH